VRERERAVLRRVGVVGLVMGAVFLAGAPAWAHVSITPPEAAKGSDAVLSFGVADESEDLTTTQVEVFFPEDHPIAEALVQAIPGWTTEVKTEKVDQPIETDEGTVTERVASIVWKGGAIEPEHFQQFSVSVGLPDDADELVFKTLQTYSDGSIVRWIEEETAGGEEPEHPAPVLALTEGGDGHGTTATTAAPTDTTAAASDSKLAEKSDVDSAKTLGIVGVVVGALGLIAAGFAIAAGRRPRTS
jgi:uncharacterized protein YcnI